jgi:hypothetical protein
MGEFFFFSMPLFFEGFMEFKGRGGVLLLFQRGGLKNDFARKGWYFIRPPLFTLPPPRFAKEFDLPTCARDGLF